MSNTFLALFISLLAGLSTILGSLIIFFKNKKNILFYSLAFAAGVMLTVSFLDLIPESFHYLSNYFYPFPTVILVAIFFSVGVIISFLIDKYLPNNQDQIYRVGIISLIAIILHNIPEDCSYYVSR